MFSSLMEPGESGVGVAFTDRLGGVSLPPFDTLNLGHSDIDDVDRVIANHRLVRAALGVGKTVTIAQVHGNDVWQVGPPEADAWHDGAEVGDSVPGQTRLVRADAMVTAVHDVALCIRVADCVPVLLADAASGIIGAAHAGRRGLLAGVLPAVVQAMRRLGASSITAWIGPHICGGCYEVPADMAADAARIVPETAGHTRWGTPSIDLGSGAEAQLRRSDCDVVRTGMCTFETPTLFSHRRDKGMTGRQAGLIWLA